MERVLFLKKNTRLAILCLMLDFYNNPEIRFYDKKLAFGFIKKCAKKFEFSKDLGNAAYFGVNRAYDILKNEKDEVREFFEDIIRYQAFVTANYKENLNEPYECVNFMRDRLRGIDHHSPMPVWVNCAKIDPFAKGHLYKTTIYNIDDSNIRISNTTNSKQVFAINDNKNADSNLNNKQTSNNKSTLCSDTINEILYKDL